MVSIECGIFNSQMNGICMSNAIRRHRHLGPLHDLLLDACPPDKEGNKSIVILAKRLEISAQYIYAWIKTNRVPPKFVKPIVKLSRGRVTYEQFHRYCFA